MALAGAFPWGRAALLPSCYFVSCTVDYTNYGSMHYERAPHFKRLKLDVAPPPLRSAVQGRGFAPLRRR